jgi:hypothetical protein
MSGVALVAFYVPVLLFTFLFIFPDPSDKKDITSKISTRPEVMDIIGRSLLAASARLIPSLSINMLVYWFYLLFATTMNIVYPNYINRKLSYVKAGISGGTWFLACVAFYVVSEPQETPTLAFITLGCMPIFGTFCGFLVHCRMQYLNPRQFKGKNIVEKVLARCYFFTDVELATRACIEIEDDLHLTLLGAQIFEEGVKRFPDNTYLNARYAIYLVFVLQKRLEAQMQKLKQSEEVGVDSPARALISMVRSRRN